MSYLPSKFTSFKVKATIGKATFATAKKLTYVCGLLVFGTWFYV